MADDADRSNVKVKVGLGPSHITASPDSMFTEEGLKSWEKTRASIVFLKINWKHMDPTKHNTRYFRPKLTPEPFVRGMKRNAHISVGSEYSEMYYVLDQEELGKAMARQLIDEHKPITDAGGKIDSLHIDGPFRVMCGPIYNPDPRYDEMKRAFKRLTPEEAYQEMIEFTKEIKSAWPHCKVGLTMNLPNWRYSKAFDWHDGGDWSTKLGGLYFMDILEGYTQALREKGMTLDFLEIDYPYNYYLRNKRNGEKFRHLQAWCTRNKVPYHQVVNMPPKAGAKSFHDGVLAYIELLHKDQIRPDLMLIQSWYKQPATHVPETEAYTSTYVGLKAAQKIKELYGDAE